MNADPRVMEFFPAPLARAESDALIVRIEQHFAEHGYGLWATEVAATGEFIGFVGLMWATFSAPFTPAVEVGWRLAASAWGHGYAPEAAVAAVDFGFAAGRPEIVSMTTHGNLRSQRVMQKIGMRRDPTDDFEHPHIPEGHPLRPHVLYRIDTATWAQKAEASR